MDLSEYVEILKSELESQKRKDKSKKVTYIINESLVQMSLSLFPNRNIFSLVLSNKNLFLGNEFFFFRWKIPHVIKEKFPPRTMLLIAKTNFDPEFVRGFGFSY